MANKRAKIVLATIGLAGYIDGKKITKGLKYRVFMIDEAHPDELIEKERVKFEKLANEEFKDTHLEYRARVVSRETHYADRFITSGN